MSPDEARKKLEALGVRGGSWGETQGQVVRLPALSHQHEQLMKLLDFLEGAVAADHKRLAALRAQLARLKFGGGA